MTHYEVLGVGPAADEATLHEAYLALARRHHPDRAGGDASRMQAINEAWATLGDPVRRARYDRAIGGTATAPRSVWVEDDAAPVVDDRDDDAPVRITVALPRWMSLVPVAAFAGSVAVFVLSLMTASGQLLGLAFMLFVLSCVLFLAAPFVALFASRRPR